MGNTSYDTTSRSARAEEMNYMSASASDLGATFKQVKEGKMHDSMNPKGVTVREARDSEEHPNTFPVIFVLDVTGSMGNIPVMLIKEGLPKMVSKIIDKGIPDVALMFMAIGDHETDNCPLQIGQFESGDEELDLWLTRTYPESGGGANAGESYGLAHYFAARHCVTDAWEKRGQKGVLIVVGDEPNLTNYPSNVIKEIMGEETPTQGFTDDQILAEAQEKWDVYHINPHGNPNGMSRDSVYWKAKLGDNYLVTGDHNEIPDMVAELVCAKGCPTDLQGSGNTEADVDETNDNPSFIR